MARNDNQRRTQPRNPNATSRGPGIGASTASTPRPLTSSGRLDAGVNDPPTPPSDATTSRFGGGSRMFTPAPNRPTYRRPQPMGRQSTGPTATPVPDIQPARTPTLPGAGNENSGTDSSPPASAGDQSIPPGTFTAPEPTAERADPRVPLSGDVGTQANNTARTSSTAVNNGGGVNTASVSPEQVRQTMLGLGINSPGGAPQARVAPVRESTTEQDLRDNLQSQQQELFDRFSEVSEAASNAPTDTPEDFQRASQLRNQAERIGQALGVTTQGGASTFGANRSFDSRIQAAGIGANADAAVSNADNETRLGISENQAATQILGDLLSSEQQAMRSRASVEAAQARNTPDPLDQARLQFVRDELQKGNRDNAFNMLMGEPFGEMSLVSDDTGRFTGLVQLRDGSFARVSPQLQNQLEEFDIVEVGDQ